VSSGKLALYLQVLFQCVKITPWLIKTQKIGPAARYALA